MKGLGNRTNFENEWQNAFSNAETEPSEEVWTKIDAHLANTEAKHYKKKAFYYKMVAAASVLLAIGLGIWGITNDNDNSSQIAVDGVGHEYITSETQELNGPVSNEPGLDEQLIAENQKYGEIEVEQTSPVANELNSSAEKSHQPNIVLMEHRDIIAALTQEEEASHQGEGFALANIDKRGLPQLQTDLEPKIREVNRVMDLRSFYAINKTHNETPKNLWAGVSFSGGGFNPDFSRESNSAPNLFDGTASMRGSNSWYESAKYNYSPNAVLYAASGNQDGNPNTIGNSQPVRNDNHPGTSYSMGLNVGTKITNKFVLQTGLHYAKSMNSTSTSLLLMDDNNKIYPLHISNSEMASTGDRYLINYQFSDMSVSSNYQFLSVPIKIGYSLIDSKLGATLFSGISSEIFINSKLGSQNNDLETVTIKAGSESPYRSVWFNGLVSMEVKYDFGGLYSAFIEPSYKISLNSLTKSDFTYSSYPRSFNIGVGLKFNLE